MAILVGIDEAGYGPLLGPLVVSSAAFEVPDELLKADMWGLLSDSVGKKRAKLAGRLLINDSKKAYNKSIGIIHLQRTVLAMLCAISKCQEGQPQGLPLQIGNKGGDGIKEGEHIGSPLHTVPQTIGELLWTLCPQCLSRLGGYAWYQRLDLCRLDADMADVGVAADVFGRNLSAQQMRPLWMKSFCLDVAHYNRMVENVKNKSDVLFTAAAGLMHHAFENAENRGQKTEDRGQRIEPQIQIVADRQGGRTNYTTSLRRMFPELELTVLREDENDSSYELRGGGKTMRIHFVVGADERFLPVALASMACKYVRELLNERMNHYFISMNPAIEPTAGYWEDGQRFVADLKTHLPNVKYDKQQMIRIK